MFETFKREETELARKRRRNRLRMMGVAAVIYAVGLTGVICYSYTDVEALPAPAIPVILMAAPPPPPPPPPPPGGHHNSVVVHHSLQPNVVLQPLDKPIPKVSNDNGGPDGVEGGMEGGVVGGQVGGVIGGVIGGVVGGTLGGTGDGPADNNAAPPQNVAPDVANAHRLCCDPQEISRPAPAVAAHIFGTTAIEICVDAYGNITSAAPLTTLQFITDKVVQTVQSTWKYKPFMVNGKPTPTCFVVAFSYVEEH